MICSRCGTEYFNEDKICPRCKMGRPKERKQLPAWLKWGGIGALAACVIAVSIFLITVVYAGSKWINGAWEGGGLALDFNTEEDTFLLINGDTVLSGVFEVKKDTIILVTPEEQTYIYRYEKLNDYKMRLTFNQDDSVRHVTVIKNEALVQEEDESEEEFYDESGFLIE